jgi:hypothetical protein
MTTIDRAIADALTAEAQARRQDADRPEVVIVEVPKDSKLEQLLCLEEKLRAAKDAADANWDEFKSALTAELQKLYAGSTAPTKGYEIPGGPMWRPMTMTWQNGKDYLPTDLIKKHIPQVWDAFKKRTTGYWVLRRKGSK